MVKKSDGEPVRENNRETVVSRLSVELRRRIAAGHYGRGALLPPEKELAEDFGVGRSSVREAIKIFQHLGVLELRVPTGTFVRSSFRISHEMLDWVILLGRHESDEIIHLCRLIETAGAASAARRRAAGEPEHDLLVQRLASLLDEAEPNAARLSVDDLLRIDFEFRALLVASSENTLLDAVFKTLHDLARNDLRTRYLREGFGQFLNEHRRIVDSLAAGRHPVM